jgi:hypothetical protein
MYPGVTIPVVTPAMMGAGSSALVVRSGVGATQSQIAATVATLLGENHPHAQPMAAAPLNTQR